MKVVYIILGAIMLIGGIYCLLTPIATYASLSWLIGFAMLFEGIASIITWNDRRKMGFADTWTLVGAIVSVALGCFLLGSFSMQFAVDLFIAYLIATWLIVGGVVRVVAAFKLRDFIAQNKLSDVGVSWVVLLVMGILVALLGILCLFDPIAIMVGVGTMLGITIVAVGIDLIVHGIRLPSRG